MRVAVLIAAALAALLAGNALAADGPVGEWLTEKRDARVRIAPCQDRGDRLCGTITWAQRPPDAPEGPLLDRNNGDPALRTRPIVGLPLLAGFAQDGENHWGGGTIYDPERADLQVQDAARRPRPARGRGLRPVPVQGRDLDATGRDRERVRQETGPRREPRSP